MSNEAPIISLRDVTVRYSDNRNILNLANLSLDAGSFHYMTGASGAGKSTLIRLLYLGQKSFSGQIKILGKDISKLNTDQAASLRQNIGVVFQDFRLLNHLSVIDNVSLPLRIRGLNYRKSCALAEEILSWVGLEQLAMSLPPTLSGGEQQRVALARAVIGKPKILLADEPTGSVDDEISVKLMHLFNELHVAGMTIILATHNHDLAGVFPHPVIHLVDGKLVIQEIENETMEFKYAS